MAIRDALCTCQLQEYHAKATNLDLRFDDHKPILSSDGVHPMQAPPLPPDEAARLAALRRLCLLDTPGEERFDRITRSVAQLFQVPIALVTLVDGTRQWFKSSFGLDSQETPREVSFCGHVILSEDPLVVEDALVDPRFADNPLVLGPPYIRFYVGIPLHGSDGARVGTLCLIDRESRTFTEEDIINLRDIAAWAEREINQMTLRQALRAASEAEAFFQIVPAPACIAGFDGFMKKVNPALVRVLKYTEAELLSIPFMEFVHPEDRETVQQVNDAMAHTGDPKRAFEIRAVAKDGSVCHLIWDIRPVEGYLYASAADVTELRKAEVRFQASEARHKQLIDLNPDIVAIHDLRGKFTFASPAASALLGLEPAELIGRLPTEFMIEEDKAPMRRFFKELREGGRPVPLQFRVLAGGRLVWLEARGALVRDGEGRPLEAVITSRDVSERKAFEDRLVQERSWDELTGLQTRYAFKERLEVAFESARRYGHEMSLCLCDLDQSNALNDTYRREASDEILRAFGVISRGELRREDVACRVGGGKFGFLFHFTRATDSIHCLNRVRARIQNLQLSNVDPTLPSFTACFGIATLCDDHIEPEGLWEAADHLLGRAKSCGTNQLEVG